jgi:hypothetical protein
VDHDNLGEDLLSSHEMAEEEGDLEGSIDQGSDDQMVDRAEEAQLDDNRLLENDDDDDHGDDLPCDA